MLTITIMTLNLMLLKKSSFFTLEPKLKQKKKTKNLKNFQDILED